ncbi:MAG: DUF4114 domain-containing protein [bacterium]|nr:DUF4114 domain-containing protein [bacterium]
MWGRTTHVFVRTAVLAAILAAASGCGPEDAPFQSDRRYYDLDIASPVKAGGSDWSSSRFQGTVLPEVMQLASQKFNKESIATNFQDLVLDPARLTLAERTRVRIYFVGEAAGRGNALGINLNGIGEKDGDPKLIFPNVEASPDLYKGPSLIDGESGVLNVEPYGERRADATLIPGDFVDLGTLPAGTQLNFFLVSGVNQQGPIVFTVAPEHNPDNVEHMVAVALEDSPYLLVSFEDLLNGGDKDYSDCVFAVEMSAYNVQALLGRIDPWRRVKQLALIGVVVGVVVGGPLGFLAWRKLQRMKRVAAARREAARLLDSGKPDEALEALRSDKNLGDPSVRRELADVEMTALDAVGDMGGLAGLYDEHPAPFDEDEEASVAVGRVQIHADDFEGFEDLRNGWVGRATQPVAWRGLEAEKLVRQEKAVQALELLREREYAGAQDAPRLARMGALLAGADPDQARDCIERAVRLDNSNAEVQRHAGAALDVLGMAGDARKAYLRALHLAPKDAFVRDEVAEFFVRHGDTASALRAWGEGLAPPTMDFIWTKALFWGRVSLRGRIDFSKHARPEGRLRPLVDLMCALPEGHFWDAAACEPVVAAHPHLADRQEALWLRLTETLNRGKEDEALSLLNMNQFGARCWNVDLMQALARLLTFRRLGFMDPKLAGQSASGQTATHPFFAELDAWTRGEREPSKEFQELVTGEEAYSAAYLAAGWFEAALQLRREPVQPRRLPDWFVQDLGKALAANRGRDAAQAFMQEQRGL